jgi:3-oxoacyl-[acyl-carrier-protein] synthase I
MSEYSLVVTGVGMVSSVGYTAPQTCAALRAGVGRFTELQGIIDANGDPVIAAVLPEVPPDSTVAEGLTIHAWHAVVEALDGARLRSGSTLLVAFVTAEADRPGNRLDLDWLKAAIQRRWGRDHPIRHGVYPGGHAGAAVAITDLSRRLARQKGSVAVIVSADALTAMPTLAHLERAGRLKSPSRPRGVIAGEAAVALVIETVDGMGHDSDACCAIAGIGMGREPVPVGRDEPCLAEGLTTALTSALESAGWQPEDVGLVYCDLNGEEYRAHEWMLATCRCLSDQSVVHPADCIGDVGAASLPLLIGIAGMALRRRYASAARALAWASSDSGARGAVCLASVWTWTPTIDCRGPTMPKSKSGGRKTNRVSKKARATSWAPR